MNPTKNAVLQQSAKPLLLFVVHQFVGTWGIAIFAYYLGSSIFEILNLIGRPLSVRSLQWILTETPFFPVQITLGVYFGWVLARRFRHRSMLWVWILPALILCYAVIAVPTLSPQETSVLVQKSGRLSHYFGWGCQPKDRCLDQLLITMPFYVATAYSIGARLAFISAEPHP
jgi:hypothetical protein